MYPNRMSATRGWSKKTPNQKERRRMMRTCGRRCFLGPKLSFPICNKGTCKVNRKGVQSAYNRARQWKHTAVAKRAKRMLRRLTHKK